MVDINFIYYQQKFAGKDFKTTYVSLQNMFHFKIKS